MKMKNIFYFSIIVIVIMIYGCSEKSVFITDNEHKTMDELIGLDYLTTYPVTVLSKSDGQDFEMTVDVSGDTVFVTTSEYIPGPNETVQPMTFTFESHLDTNGYLIYNDTSQTYWIVTFDPDETPSVAMVGSGFASGSGSGRPFGIYVCECGGVPPQGRGEVTGCVRIGSNLAGYTCVDQTCGEGCDGCFKDENMMNVIAPKKTVAIVRGEILIFNGSVYSY